MSTQRSKEEHGDGVAEGRGLRGRRGDETKMNTFSMNQTKQDRYFVVAILQSLLL